MRIKVKSMLLIAWKMAPMPSVPTPPTDRPVMPMTAPMMSTHRANCVRPTSATPMILPIMSWNGVQLLTITSTMRLVFSSMTLFMIMAPYMMTNI